jgi:proteasome-associated ATPase
VQHLLDACVDEFKENEDLPNTTNPDDWARISGKKGERIVFIRTLITGKQGTEPGRSIDTWPTPASTCSRRDRDALRVRLRSERPG